MLYTEVVEPATLELIRELQQKKYFKDFYLVGGTALALYYGHRKSLDIDLFSKEEFNGERLLEQVNHDFSYQVFLTAEHTLKGSISGVNVDVIAHRYPYLNEPKEVDGIHLLSEEDLIAMKLNAISVSGQRSKDFVDIYYGLNNFSIADMVTFYKTKYDQSSASHVLKSLIYFDDVDLAGWPVLLNEPELTWGSVKERIEEGVIEYANF